MPTPEAMRRATPVAQPRAASPAWRSHLWSYYYSRGRVQTNAPFGSGVNDTQIQGSGSGSTIQYQQSSGAVPYLVTLTPGTDGDVWPAWAGTGQIVLPGVNVVNTSITSITYQVVSRISDTQLQLSVNSNPGFDIAAGTTYTLYQDTYPLPIDCTSIDRAMLVGYATFLEFEAAGQWLLRQQIYRGPALPRFYTTRGDSSFMGSVAISFFPAPDNNYEVEFMYNRQPRPLKTEAYTTGKVSIAAGSTALTGVGTSFDSIRHPGTIIRLSNDSINIPTSDVGSNPATLERVVLAVNTPTSITVDSPAPVTLSNSAYIISDPADIEPLSMRLALLRAAEYQLGVAHNRKDRDMLEKAFTDELIRAREADSRNFSQQSPRSYRPFPTRLADFPRGADA